MSLSKLFGKQDAIKTSPDNIAVSGFDPVAYFTEGKPLKGTSQFQFHWHGATWQFSTAAHRELFARDPKKFSPQFGGYCVLGISMGKFFDGDPEVWNIVDEKLYLLGNSEIARRWNEDIHGNIEKATHQWPTLIA